MKRRALLLAAAGSMASTYSIKLSAQTTKVYRVLWLSVVTQTAGTPFLKSFSDGLSTYGYVPGRNLIIDARFGENSGERLLQLAREAMALKPTVVVTHGAAIQAARKLDETTPVVIGFSGDPVELGIAKTLGRPGGRFTGVSMLAYDLVGKRVELLHEIAPKMRRLAVLSRPDHAGDAKELEATREAAARFGLEVSHFPARNPNELQSAFIGIAAARAEAMVVHPDGFFVGNRDAITRFSIEQGIPAISGWAELTDAGMLITYGPNREEIFRRLSYFVDRILKGARPQDLPIETPTRIELIVNLKTAKALGITVPPTVMVRADRVIQ